MHVHMVFFWLKEPGNQAHRSTFQAGLKGLVQDPNVLRSRIGGPAATNRDVVDNSYDFAAVIEFTDLAAHNAYQVGQAHDTFLQTCLPLWSHVKVYDLEV